VSSLIDLICVSVICMETGLPVAMRLVALVDAFRCLRTHHTAVRIAARPIAPHTTATGMTNAGSFLDEGAMYIPLEIFWSSAAVTEESVHCEG